MAQSKKDTNEIRALLLKTGAVSDTGISRTDKTVDPVISRHNAILSRQRELGKVPVPAVSFVAQQVVTNGTGRNHEQP